MQINATQAMPNMAVGQSNSLSQAQKSQLKEIMSNYDPSTATREDMEAMREEIKSAGIEPSREIGKMLNEAGFPPPPDRSSEGARPEEGGRKPPPNDINTSNASMPPPKTSQVATDSYSQSLFQELLEAIKEYQSDETTEENLNATLQKFSLIEFEIKGVFIDTYDS